MHNNWPQIYKCFQICTSYRLLHSQPLNENKLILQYKNNISGVSRNFEVKKLFPNVHVGVELKTTYFINTSEMFSLLSGVIVERVVTETLPRR